MANTVSLATSAVPSTTAVTLTDANKAYSIVLPRDCGSVVIQPLVNQAKFSYEATESADMGADAILIAAGAFNEWTVDRPANTGGLSGIAQKTGAIIFLQTAVGASEVVLSLRPRDAMYPI